MNSIPLIDLDGAEEILRRQIDEACCNTGFLVISNHGVPEQIISTCWQECLKFFDLPLDERMQVALPHPGYPNSYGALANETLSKSLNQESPPDLKEGFAVGPLTIPDRKLDKDEAAFVYAPNLWPQNLPELRPAFQDYIRKMDLLARRLMRLFALVLDLPEDYFDQAIDEPISACRANHYPALDTPPAPCQLRA